MSRRRTRTGLSADAVLESALEFRRPWFIAVTTPLLWFPVFIFWGGKNLSTAAWFAASVVGTGLAWATQGWEPWNMALNQVLRGRALRREEYGPIQRTTVEFFKTPRLRLIQGMLIALGAGLPWLISGLSVALGGQPFRPWPHAVPWWGMLIVGVGEAIRGRAIALYVLAGQLHKSWPALLRRAEAMTPTTEISREQDLDRKASDQESSQR